MNRLATVTLIAALALAACEREPPARVDFELPALDGGTVAAADFEGRVLLVEFWATWCTPCRAQAAILEELHGSFSGREVAFLAVSLGEEPETVRSFVRRYPFPYPVLLDSEDRLSGELGIYALPTVLVLGRSGEVLFSRPGLASGDTLRRVLEEALSA